MYFQILGVGVRDVCDGDGDGDGGEGAGETQDTCASDEEREEREDAEDAAGGGAAGDAIISAEHVTKREDERESHVIESESAYTNHVTDQGGDVTARTERDVTNGANSKRRRIL